MHHIYGAVVSGNSGIAESDFIWNYERKVFHVLLMLEHFFPCKIIIRVRYK